jgi:hypothetical protein
MNRASRANKRPGSVKERSTSFVIITWIASILAVGLLLLIGNAVKADIAGFRSCSVNNSGLTVTSCGRQGINAGDAILFGLFVMAASLVVTLFTAAWRMTRRPSR